MYTCFITVQTATIIYFEFVPKLGKPLNKTLSLAGNPPYFLLVGFPVELLTHKQRERRKNTRIMISNYSQCCLNALLWLIRPDLRLKLDGGMMGIDLACSLVVKGGNNEVQVACEVVGKGASFLS